MVPEIFVSDVGTMIRYRFMEDGTGVNITGATVKYFFVSPDATLVFEVIAADSNLANGLAEYITLSGHWQGITGNWVLHPYATVSASQVYYGEPKTIRVNPVPVVTP